jgi:glycosyltransferase involved in cell wall biosynthesis
MNIGVNLKLLNPGKIGGMEGYVRNLLKQLLEIDSTVRFTLFVTRENESTFFYPSERVTKILIPHKNYEPQILRGISQNNISLYFCPLLILEPLVRHIPSVVTIPDMQHEFFPRFFPKDILEWRRKNFKVSAISSTRVLAISNFTARTIIDILGVPPDKVHCTHLSGDDEVFGKEADQGVKNQVKEKYGLPDVYGYFPANTWPHKNHITLLRALKIYKERFGPSPKIVLTGAQDTGHKDLVAAIGELGLQEDVVFLGYIPKNEIPYLYRNASFLVFPSFFEGFGMPVLEAMLSDCPVICSDTTSLPEVGGDAVLYFNPLDPADIAQSMKLVLDNQDLRQSLIQKGRVQAAKFSWKATAEQTFAIFRELRS